MPAPQEIDRLARLFYAAEPVIRYQGDDRRELSFEEAAADDSLGVVARAREFAAIALADAAERAA